MEKWSHQEWGEPKSGMVRRIINKPGMSNGGQVVLVYYVDWI